MTRLASIFPLLVVALLIVAASCGHAQNFYTLQSSGDLKSWNTVTNAVSYTVWWLYQDTDSYIVTTNGATIYNKILAP